MNTVIGKGKLEWSIDDITWLLGENYLSNILEPYEGKIVTILIEEPEDESEPSQDSSDL